jgi:hypothetical protein
MELNLRFDDELLLSFLAPTNLTVARVLVL